VSSIAIGALAGALCHLALGLKLVFKVDDALDVAAVHLVGGLVGSAAVGVFASKAVNPNGADGLLSGGGYGLLGIQATASLAVLAYSFTGTLLLTVLTRRFVSHRVSAREESQGLDVTQHGEAAYYFDTASIAEKTSKVPAVVALASKVPGGKR
jgi:Amt family ammonium transporter